MPPSSPLGDSAVVQNRCQAMLARLRGAQGLAVERSANPTSIDVIASALEPASLPVSQLSSPDGAMTLMLSDIANAEDVISRLGPERWEQLVSDHHLLVERVLEHHDGQVVRFERDGFLASFNSAHGGLHAAVDLQRTFGGDGQPDSSGPELRIGVHSGFVITGGDDLLGRNVVLDIADRGAREGRGDPRLLGAQAVHRERPELPVRASRRASLQGAARRARGLQRSLALRPVKPAGRPGRACRSRPLAAASPQRRPR